MASYNITYDLIPIGSATIKTGSIEVNGLTQEEGEDVNILVVPASGFRFISISTGGIAVSTNKSYNFIMPSNNITFVILMEEIVIPVTSEIGTLYDTPCPKFFFIKDLPDRIFVGDVVDLSGYLTTELDDEPIGFDSAVFELIRDKEYHGFNYDLSLDTLSFERGLGYEYLVEQLLNFGTDANIRFVFGYGVETGLTIVYIGRVDFNEFNQEESEIVSVNLINDDFGSLLSSSFDIPQVSTLTQSVLLKSKALPQKVQYTFPYPEYITGTSIPVLDPFVQAFFAENYRLGVTPQIKKTDPSGYLYINDGKEGDDLQTFATYDFQVTPTNPFLNPEEEQKYVFKVEESGEYTTRIRLRLGINTNGVVWSDYVNPFKMYYIVTETDGETFKSIEFLNPLALPSDSIFYDKTLLYFGDFNDELTRNQVVYIYIAVDTSIFPTGGVVNGILGRAYNFNRNIPQIEVNANTVVANSFCNVEPSFNVINNVFKSASEVSYDILKSDLFDVGGCMHNLTMTNGFNVRGGVTTNASPEQLNIKVSPKKVFDGLSAILNLGWGIEYDEFRQERIRIEGTSYFFQNNVVLTLDQNKVTDFKLSVDPSAYFNEIEIGYSKYSKNRDTDKEGTIDDVHTKHTYHTPVKTNKNKKSIVSDLILSGYEIEYARRKQFDKSSGSTNSNYANDEDVFCIMTTDEVSSEPSAIATIPNSLITEQSAFFTRGQNGTNPLIQMTMIPFIVGESVIYTGSDFVTQTRTVSFYESNSEIVFDVLTGNFTVIFDVTIGFAEAFTGGTGIFPITIQKQASADTYKTSESIEPFEVVNNVISPSTAYNLRFTPKRMLLNWGNVLNGGFRALEDRIIKFKQGDANIVAITKLKSTEPCLLGDVDNVTVTENSDINLSLATWGNDYLFVPINVEFTYPLTFLELTTIRRAMRGQDDVNNYGYIEVPFCDEVYEVFLDRIEFNPTQTEAKITGRLKRFGEDQIAVGYPYEYPYTLS